MKAPNSDDWLDLPKRMNCFTVRNAAMYNLNTGKIIQYYSANTKIAVVQKCVTTEGTFYRTAEAAHHYLNYAFKASAFGLPDEKAPSAPSPKTTPLGKLSKKLTPVSSTPSPEDNTNNSATVVLPKGGEGRQRKSWFSKLFRRKNGITKNS